MRFQLKNGRFTKKLSLGITRLMLAAKNDNLKSCLKLIEQGESADDRTALGVSLLHFAAVNATHGLGIICYFFTYHGLGTATDSDGEEPIHYATRAGHFNLAQKLLEMRPTRFTNLLHFFVAENQIEMVNLVHSHDRSLLRGVDPDGRNALHLAAEFADSIMCEWLIYRGVDTKALSANKATVVHHAVRNKFNARRIVRYLANWKLKMDEESESGETPIDVAVFLGNADCALELLCLGAKIRSKNLLLVSVKQNQINLAQLVHWSDKEQIKEVDSKGRNAMHLAAEKADLKMCEWLLSVGVDVAALCTERKCNVLHRVGLNEEHGKSLVQFFLSLGLNLNQRDEHGETPLHFALRASNLKVAEEMVTLGADLKVVVNDLNILHFCVRQKNLESAQFVHKWDSEMIMKVDLGGKTALHYAAETADLEVCQWLIEAGVNINARTFDMKSALSFVPRNDVKVRRYLMSLGMRI
ncbi:putative ankyrin repeat protein RF_0381 [Cloeon dipterum]|uniref:putative ankyrin repeat protein RF_0381 n=1 Tax=Cloeon dipterum TaxID=197152 RepID=UPI00322062A3